MGMPQKLQVLRKRNPLSVDLQKHNKMSPNSVGHLLHLVNRRKIVVLVVECSLLSEDSKILPRCLSLRLIGEQKVKRFSHQRKHSDMEVKKEIDLQVRRVNSQLLVGNQDSEGCRKFSSLHLEVEQSVHQVRTQSSVAQQHLHPSLEAVANQLQEVRHLPRNKNPYSVKASTPRAHLHLKR